MASTQRTDSETSPPSTRLTLKIWFPNCWDLQTTAASDAGLIAHRVYEIDDQMYARITAYADTTADVAVLLDEIRSSELTERVHHITECFNPNISHEGVGNTTEELLVRYQPEHSIHNALISRGFIPEEPIRVRDGYEYWTVIVAHPRQEVQCLLNEIRAEMDADVIVESMESAGSGTSGSSDRIRLSERQREVIELARLRGYYSWPREASASELAEEIGISKATLLEHLRKAEAKLLDPG